MDNSEPNMVFHAPYPLNRAAKSASGIRPVRMRDAFEQLGYKVWEVTGTSAERRAAMRRVRAACAQGVIFDFCYSESSTLPTSMTESHHLPLHPLMDHSFLAWLRRHRVPVGLFYRDIYWRFPEYGAGMNPVKKHAALAMYRYDLLAYRAAVDVLYLPSLPMAPYVKADALTMAALPPGHDDPEPTPGPTHGVHMFYVGGLGAHYRLIELARAVNVVADEGFDVSLTICTLPQQWEAERGNYEGLVGRSVHVVHAHGAELRPYYDAANVAAFFVEPSPYRTFEAAVKRFEYVGMGKPILATEGTLTGTFVTEHGIGWAVPYRLDAVTDLLRELAQNPEQISRAREQVLAVRPQHAWLERARQVASDLSAMSRPGQDAAE